MQDAGLCMLILLFLLILCSSRCLSWRILHVPSRCKRLSGVDSTTAPQISQLDLANEMVTGTGSGDTRHKDAVRMNPHADQSHVKKPRTPKEWWDSSSTSEVRPMSPNPPFWWAPRHREARDSRASRLYEKCHCDACDPNLSGSPWISWSLERMVTWGEGGRAAKACPPAHPPIHD